jgi:hypothetical protein
MMRWKATLAMLAALFTSIALADDFKTIDGKEYKNVTVKRVEPDGIVLSSKLGITKIYFTELPKDVQQRFNYDPDKVDAYSATLQRPEAESQQEQADQKAGARQSAASEGSSPNVIRETRQPSSWLGDAHGLDDKIKAVMNSPEMQRARNSKEQITVLKNSDLYKRGYAKQSTAVKVTISDAERDFDGAESELQVELSLPKDLIAAAGLEEINKHLSARQI